MAVIRITTQTYSGITRKTYAVGFCRKMGDGRQAPYRPWLFRELLHYYDTGIDEVGKL